MAGKGTRGQQVIRAKDFRPHQSEDSIQMSCVSWFRAAHPELARLLHHSANEGKRTTRIVHTHAGTRVVCSGGARLKAMGMQTGFPDLFLAVPRRGMHGLFIEMKSETGRLEPSQREMLALLSDQGYATAVCRSLDDFQDVTDSYLQ